MEASRQRSISALRPEELQELALLYRQIASDLSTVREDGASSQLTTYLNRLLGRAHNLIYMGRRASTGGIWTFYKDTFPAVFRETFSDTFAAFALFLVSGVIGALLGIADPGFLHHFLGVGMMNTIEQHKMWTDSIVGVKPAASSFIMTNNITVSFATFASGVTAGIGTIYLLVFNGFQIGVIGIACWREGMSLPLWSFVAAHGVLELPAIFIAGGAGLGIARGMLFPGNLPRRLSLVIAGGRSVRLVLGTIPMLIVAGLVEGFISPSGIPATLKFALAALLFSLLVLYLNRKPSDSQPLALVPASANASSK